MNLLKEALRQVWDGPCSCSVCRQRLTPLAVSCLGGHMFCLDCKLRLNNCPVCSKTFNIEAHAAFKRVLELLPKCCRYMGCSEIPDDVTRLKQHETWCGHRPTRCKLCSWSEQAKDLYSHCLKQHFVIHKTQKVLDLLLNLSKDQASLCLMNTYDQIFWVTFGFDRASAVVYAQIVWVPDGSINRNLFEAQVKFQVGSCKTSMTKPIIHQESINASQSNLFKVLLSTLKSSTDIVGQSVRFGLVIVKT